MIRLTKYDLQELAQIFVLANTPISLFKALIRSRAVDKLRKYPPQQLIEYYDHIATRPRRNEVVIALAYALLSAVLFEARDVSSVPVNASRLHWGERIRQYLAGAVVNTDVISIPPSAPVVTAVGSPSVNTHSPLLGPDGLPAIWRNQ